MSKWRVVALSILLVAGCSIGISKAEEKRKVELNIFMPGSTDDIAVLDNFEKDLGIKFISTRFYLDWSDSLDMGIVGRFHDHGAIPDLTWQPQINGTGVINTDVTSGKYDTYINNFALSVKALNFPIRISLAPEMNGYGWPSWEIGKNGNTPENHKLFWRYVIEKFDAIGANQVQWIWAPNVHHSLERYSYGELYPGDDYVDYVGLEGYNWGTSQKTEEWQSVWQTFEEVFDSSYNDLVALSSKNIFITEIGSTELGGDKASWILDMFDKLASKYTRVSGFTWFNMNKETDWRIDSSATSQAAFIAGVKALQEKLDSSDQDTIVGMSQGTGSGSGAVKRATRSSKSPNLEGRVIVSRANGAITSELPRGDSLTNDSGTEGSEVAPTVAGVSNINETSAGFYLGNIFAFLAVIFSLLCIRRQYEVNF
ncbi:MAG: glycosyl hydrolase [bacterium]|nr:glycosyl hydrolase [bacterium]